MSEQCDPGRCRWEVGHRGLCVPDRPKCEAWMPLVGERCARRPGHRWEHRSRYALDNAARVDHQQYHGVAA